MASVRQIRRRIRSVENTAKITKAMSMIAASKMRRTQESALRGRPYSDLMQTLLAHLAAQTQDDEEHHPLLMERPRRNVGLVVISPDRGLTGGLNSNINRAAGQFVVDQQGAGVKVIAMGKKGRDFMVRTGQDVQAVFTDIPDRPGLDVVTPVARMVIDSFTNEDVDAVFVAYADFVNTTMQRPTVAQLLPVVPAELEATQAVGYIYEPDERPVLDALLPRYVEMQLYHYLLEGIASEQSARMVAMRNATDNANEMVEDLTLVMNKARQETITKELLDIVGGVAAVE
ncbi:MAG: ATP synthase F1 subunit gamma [Chloroflexi bacterium]|nr:ATP synthase F1 subunit gamma [Chloroflexota bacterium]